MELLPQVPDAPSYRCYLTSPSDCSAENLQFYSAPTSPVAWVEFPGDDPDEAEKDRGEEFEFDTSRRFVSDWESNDSRTFKYPDSHGKSILFSTMAFADDLFSDGVVLPLKLPPRLHRGSCQSPNTPSSPKSPVKTFSLSRRSAWNDGFDPFAVALQKVSEEGRGRKSVHRRARSHSPLRAPSPIQLKEAKGTMYARWVRSQTVGRNRTLIERFSFRRRASNVKSVQEKPSLATPPLTKAESKGGSSTKMNRVKGILMRYASFGRENTLWKPNYFKKLGVKFKANGKKKASADPKMAVVKYNPKLQLCLGFAPESPAS